ncbi:MAG TPA: hypothetical protein VGE34_00485 [Candidatus Saccharimonadales bacterium]
MKIRPKSPEELQAQYASYGEGVEYSQSDKVFLALAERGIADTVTLDSEGKQDYLRHLRSMDGEKKEEIKKRAAMLAHYDEFKQPVGQLLNSEDVVELGKGTRSTVYLLVLDDKKYAVRVPRIISNRLVHNHLSAGVAAQGLVGLEKIIAASYKDKVVISEAVTGKHATEMSREEAEAVPDSHIEAFVEARIEASRRGIGIDMHSQNILYSPADGFTDIDYGLLPQPKELTTVDAVHGILSSFSSDDNRGVEGEAERQNLSAMHRRIVTYAMDNLDHEERARLLQAVSSRRVTNQLFDDASRIGGFTVF